MHSNENWDDLRFVLCVARNGSLSAAAKELGVNHATVLRRVNAFEDRHELRLFIKNARGYKLNPDFERVFNALSDAESAVLGVERAVTGAMAPLRGLVRVTSTDSFCETFLPQVLADIQSDVPELRIELISNNAHLDLARLDADITVRPTNKLPEDLMGERAAMLDFGVYAAPDCAHKAYLGLSGPLARSNAAKWIADNALDQQSAIASSDSFLTLRRMAGIGMGQAVLPCLIGESDPDLRRIDLCPKSYSVPVWVASHKDMGNTSRTRVVRRQLAQRIMAHIPQEWGD